MIKGSHHKLESKQKISAARTGTTQPYETRVKIAMTSARKLARLAGRYRSPAGHLECVYEGITKWQPGWKVPIDSCRVIVDKFIMDPEYKRLFKEWEDSGYNPLKSPVLMRKVKKLGFTADNLELKIKNSYSWWNEDSALLKCLQEAMENEQVILKEDNKNQEDILREQIKKRSFKKP